MLGDVRPSSLTQPRVTELAPPSWIPAGAGVEIRPAFAPAQAAASDTAEPGIPDEVAEAVAAAEQQIAEAIARGEAEGRERFEQVSARMEQLLADLARERAQLAQLFESELRELSVHVAEVILGAELAHVGEEFLTRTVREAVALVADGTAVTIAVAPADQPLVEQQLDALRTELPAVNELNLRAEPAIEAGCVVEVAHACVDATVASRLQSVAQALRSQGGS